jgi:hypothetical protein
VLLITNLLLVGLIALALWVANHRGRARANRARAARAISAQADLIPGRPVERVPPRMVRRDPATPATWAASLERGETGPPPSAPARAAPAPPPPVIAEAPVVAPPEPRPPEPRLPEARPPEARPPEAVAPTNGGAPPARPAVLVVPREKSWVVRRDGASRVSSVHTTRSAAEERGRKTAQRERVVLEVRDEASEVLDRTDYSVRAGAAGTATRSRPDAVTGSMG